MANIYSYVIENVFSPFDKQTGNATFSELKELIPNDQLNLVEVHEQSSANMPFSLDIEDGNNHYLIERIK